ncbi:MULTISPECIES: alpha-galactosidase [Enterococcus]|uniref:alpha-galactosidase n=1 Tax=Enterococcus TaxID=1350 RepID=UPI00065DD78F|nr:MULTISPECIES: alpha-galactosidase [Enterococcus]KAF1301627.1 alpha-galactosidase [Enterococcus sp. JM9B]
MITVTDNRYFHLKNDKISYLFYVMPNHQIGHLYFGKSLGELSETDLFYLSQKKNKSAGTVKFSEENGQFTLADHLQEYPVYGSSDFREGAIEITENTTPLYVDFRYCDYQITDEKKRVLAKPATFADKGKAETIQLRLIDEERRLVLMLNYTIFENSGVIVKNQVIKNLGNVDRTVQRMMSGVLELPTDNYEFLHLAGAWLKERHLTRHSLAQGTVAISSLKGASGHQHNPFIALQEKNSSINQGAVYGAHLIYSGNFLGQAEVDEWGNTRLLLGIQPNYFSWKLVPGGEFETPEAMLSYSNNGLNGLAQESAAFIEQHVIDPQWLEKPRPIVFNNWEATYFDFTHDKLVSLAKAGKKLGMECFVVDDGWFGKRDDDRSSLGDWVVDKRKFPKGIAAFAAEIHELDLQLGIWFEPEMISPDSQLYQNHPEWVVRHPFERISIGRGQYVLDFANPEVVEAIYKQMKEIIQATKLDYIKWDMNRNITEAYSMYLEQNKVDQTEFFHRYILGVYALYTKILTDFPAILIEGCAGGGGRYDLGILFYSPQIWPSDDSDAVERLAIQTGTLLAYPLSSFSNHVSASPNHQVLRNTSLKMRQDVAMFGPLGYELDITKLSQEEGQEIRTRIAFYREHRELLTFGTFYQLNTGDKNEVAWAVYDHKKGKAIVGFYRILAKPNATADAFLPLPFLNPHKKYQVNGKVLSGQVLREIGIREPYQFNGANHEQAQVKGDFQSYIYQIELVK